MPRKQNKRRADGRIAVQVYLGMVDGKRKYKTVYGNTQKEADEAALQIKLALRKGIDVTAERDTFGDWTQRFLKLKKAKVSDGQYRAYRSCLTHFNKIEHMQISKIKTSDIQDIIDELEIENPTTGKPTSHKTLEMVKMTASQIFELAISNRVMDYNPTRAVEINKNAPRGKRRALTDEEQGWVINTPHRAQRSAMIMMYAGLRRGELIALTWGSIHLKAFGADCNSITIDKAAAREGSELEIKPFTKTEAGMRTVYIPNILAAFLAEEKASDLKFYDSQNKTVLLDTIPVCRSARGDIMSLSAWDRMWDSYLCDLNIKYGKFTKQPNKFDPKGVPMMIPHITAHWLRHTFASLLYLSGVDVVTARKQMGHTDIKTTLQIYTDFEDKYKIRSMTKMDKFIECKSNASQMVSQTT